MKILAVDDDPFILELLPMIAAKAGFMDVTTTPSGELAQQAMKDAAPPFECLLFDINMPNMNGIDLCFCTRDRDRGPELSRRQELGIRQRRSSGYQRFNRKSDTADCRSLG